jgi:hypothetical protein
MFDAVMATAGAPRRGSSKGATREPGQFVCQGVCVASDAINSLDAIPTLSNTEHQHARFRLRLCDSKLNPGCLDVVCVRIARCVGVWNRV